MSNDTLTEFAETRISPSQQASTERGRMWAAYLAEGLGTFALVFAGSGAIMIDTLSHGQITHVGVGLVFGLVITVMIYAFGHISGAHFNPAVTLAFVVTRHFPLRQLIGYWIAQLLGALLAALCLRLLLGDVASLGTTLPTGNGGAWQSFGFETLLTFFLMIVIMAMATDTRAVGQAAALAIGATVGLEALFAGPICGASMNPARSLGPALMSWTWNAQWVYVLGPMLGALAGALVYRWLHEASSLRQTLNHTQRLRFPRHMRRTSMSEQQTPAKSPLRVLFLCTHNSSRSQMAEGLLRARGGSAFEVFSAGTEPRSVHPLAIKAMQEIGIDISEQAAKGIEAFASEPSMDLVVTVCHEAQETCPYFPNARRQVHWGFPDPSRVTGTEQERLAAFRHIRDLIAAKIDQFLERKPAFSFEQLYAVAKAEEQQA